MAVVLTARVLFIVNDPPYGTERAYNALRLAISLRKKEAATEMRVFLVGDGASCVPMALLDARYARGETFREAYPRTRADLERRPP